MAWPRLARPVWFRIAALLGERGLLGAAAARMARHLTHHADEQGYVREVERMIGAYRVRHGVSRRTAYKDLAALGTGGGAGLVRQTRAPAPGRSARYQLCVPRDLPGDLPASLARAVRRAWARPSREGPSSSSGGAARPGRVRLGSGTAEHHRALSGAAMYSYGPAAGKRETGGWPAWVHTCPLYARDNPHPRRGRSGSSSAAVHASVGEDLSQLAGQVLERCRSRWLAQRPASSTPGPPELAGVVPLVAGALRYLPTPDVVEALSDRVASARDLASVLVVRLRRVIAAGRRARAAPADEQGRRYAELLAERAEEAARQQESPGRAAAIAAERARQERHRREKAERARQMAAAPAAPRMVESGPAFAAEVARAEAEAEQRRRREREAALAARVAEHRRAAAAVPRQTARRPVEPAPV
ncbi:hypothetical protein [Nocardiopsis halophila]|uniref:hypothetical protein n=1 Tax=Nocardiopsis halophila TaxID=141692 RepID=UPI0003463BE9|nr:hypothetical protein [Nocardiopsis halophila]